MMLELGHTPDSTLSDLLSHADTLTVQQYNPTLALHVVYINVCCDPHSLVNQTVFVVLRNQENTVWFIIIIGVHVHVHIGVQFARGFQAESRSPFEGSTIVTIVRLVEIRKKALIKKHNYI